jgi:hypothetical protein
VAQPKRENYAEWPDTTIERDYYGWLWRQAELLRRAEPHYLDWTNLAEELEGMARNEERSLGSFIERLLVHLLKWAHAPIKRSNSWEVSIENSRDEIEDALERSPSLKNKLDRTFLRAYIRARRAAAMQMKLSKEEREAKLPAVCPWSSELVLSRDLWPEATPETNGKS